MSSTCNSSVGAMGHAISMDSCRVGEDIRDLASEQLLQRIRHTNDEEDNNSLDESLAEMQSDDEPIVCKTLAYGHKRAWDALTDEALAENGEPYIRKESYVNLRTPPLSPGTTGRSLSKVLKRNISKLLVSTGSLIRKNQAPVSPPVLPQNATPGLLHHLDPKRIYYTVPHIPSTNPDGTALAQIAQEIRSGNIALSSVLPLRVYQDENNDWCTIDNRWLWVMQQAGVQLVQGLRWEIQNSGKWTRAAVIE